MGINSSVETGRNSDENFENLSGKAQDFVIVIASSAMEGISFTNGDIEEIMKNVGIENSVEKKVILNKLTELRVFKEGGRK